MKKILCSLAALCCVTFAASSFAEELFPSAKPVEFTPSSLLASASTANGYALYQGDENWHLIQLTTQKTGSFGEATALTLGTVRLSQYTEQGGWTASMYVTANLTTGGPNDYMTGNPCAGTHLIAVNKGVRQEDNCLTVDAQPSNGAEPITLLVLRISHAKSSGRLYIITLLLNTNQLGFAKTEPADWTAAAVQASPERAAFVQRLQKWGESLQSASERAVEFRKPQDVFAGIPSYRTLLPTSAPQ